MDGSMITPNVSYTIDDTKVIYNVGNCDVEMTCPSSSSKLVVVDYSYSSDDPEAGTTPTSLEYTIHHRKSTATSTEKDLLPRGNSRTFCYDRMDDCVIFSRKKLGNLFYYLQDDSSG